MAASRRAMARNSRRTISGQSSRCMASVGARHSSEATPKAAASRPADNPLPTTKE